MPPTILILTLAKEKHKVRMPSEAINRNWMCKQIDLIVKSKDFKVFSFNTKLNISAFYKLELICKVDRKKCGRFFCILTLCEFHWMNFDHTHSPFSYLLPDQTPLPYPLTLSPHLFKPITVAEFFKTWLKWSLPPRTFFQHVLKAPPTEGGCQPLLIQSGNLLPWQVW